MSASRVSNKATLIISLGLLQTLNHNATGAAFIRWGTQPGKLLPGATLDIVKLNEVMPQILAVDVKFKTGECGVAEFRKAILDILQLQAITDDEFDAAWNAMQGNTTRLAAQLNRIKDSNKNANIILVSKTNPIHIKNIYQSAHPGLVFDDAQLNNPLTLLGMPLFVSYLSPACRATASETAFYEEVLTSQQLVAQQTAIVLQRTSDSTYNAVKQRDEESTSKIVDWATRQGISIIDRKPREDLTVVLDPLASVGLKLHSGKVPFWSKSRNSLEPVNSIRASEVFRP
jgi:hypothetical protein